MMSEFEEFIASVEARRPNVRDLREDLHERHRILDELVALRKASGMSQTAVAKIMGVTQPTISQFEAGIHDLKLSTLQRYARAVGARLRLSKEEI